MNQVDREYDSLYQENEDTSKFVGVSEDDFDMDRFLNWLLFEEDPEEFNEDEL